MYEENRYNQQKIVFIRKKKFICFSQGKKFRNRRHNDSLNMKLQLELNKMEQITNKYF